MDEKLNRNQNPLSGLGSRPNSLEINQKKPVDQKEEDKVFKSVIDKDIKEKVEFYVNITNNRSQLKQTFERLIERTHVIGSLDIYSGNEDAPEYFYSKIRVVDGKVEINVDYPLEAIKDKSENELLERKTENQRLIDSAVKIIDSFGLSEEELKECFSVFDLNENDSEMLEAPSKMDSILDAIATRKIGLNTLSRYRQGKYDYLFGGNKDLKTTENNSVNNKELVDKKEEELLKIDESKNLPERLNSYKNITENKDDLKDILKKLIERTHTVGRWDIYSGNEDAPEYFYSKIRVVDGKVEINVDYPLESRIEIEKRELSKIDENIKRVEEKKEKRNIFQALFKKEEKELVELAKSREKNEKEILKSENELLERKTENQRLIDSAVKIIDSFGLSEEELKECFSVFDLNENDSEMLEAPSKMDSILSLIAAQYKKSL